MLITDYVKFFIILVTISLLVEGFVEAMPWYNYLKG